MKAKNETTEVTEAKNYLLKMFKTNKTVYTTLRNVSSNGMTRHIKVFTVSKNPYTKKQEIVNITWYVGKILDYRISEKTDSLIVGGCGMDMGFHVVYSLSSELYRGKNRSGYVLKQQWI